MIVALVDLVKYALRCGKYGKNQKDGGMRLAFVGQFPDEIIEQLNEGDMIVTQRLDSPLSWAMMYFTSSPVDHIAFYAGDGKVLHMTFNGSKLHSLQAISKGARVFIARMGLESQVWLQIYKEQENRIDKGNSLTHKFSPKIQLIFLALKIVSGKYPDRIKIHIILDVVVTCVIIYLAVLFYIGTHFGALALCAYFVAVASNWIAHTQQKRRGENPMVISYPDIAYRAFYRSGGLIFTTMGPIVVCELGLLPLKVVFRLAGKRPDDGSNDQFKVTRQFFSDLIEGWDLHPKTKQAEQEDGAQHDEKKTKKGPDDPR